MPRCVASMQGQLARQRAGSPWSALPAGAAQMMFFWTLLSFSACSIPWTWGCEKRGHFSALCMPRFSWPSPTEAPFPTPHPTVALPPAHEPLEDKPHPIHSTRQQVPALLSCAPCLLPGLLGKDARSPHSLLSPPHPRASLPPWTFCSGTGKGRRAG